MKKENILVFILICMAVAGVLIYQYSVSKKKDASVLTENVQVEKQASGIAWESFSEGFSKGRTLDKPIFLYFHAEWCSYCKKLKQTTFKDQAVLRYLSKNFISIQVDTDKNKEIANQWRVRGLPTLWFLGPDGSKIGNVPGYVDAVTMIKFLKYINTKSYQTKKFDEFVRTL